MLFVSVAIGRLGPIRKRFGPNKWDNDRHVSPAEVSSIICAVASEERNQGAQELSVIVNEQELNEG